MTTTGGLGIINGTFIGAAFILNSIGNNVFHGAIDATIISAIEQMIFGVLIIVFIIYEPLDMARFWENINLEMRAWTVKQS